MVVGVSVFELHVPAARGLKEKRKVVKSLIDRIYRRFRVSIAETDLQDLHQRSEISLAAVGQDQRDAERLMDALRDLIDGEPAAVLTRWQPCYLDRSELEGELHETYGLTDDEE